MCALCTSHPFLLYHSASHIAFKASQTTVRADLLFYAQVWGAEGTGGCNGGVGGVLVQGGEMVVLCTRHVLALFSQWDTHSSASVSHCQLISDVYCCILG